VADQAPVPRLRAAVVAVVPVGGRARSRPAAPPRSARPRARDRDDPGPSVVRPAPPRPSVPVPRPLIQTGGRGRAGGGVDACLAMGALQVSMTTFALPRPPRVAASLTPLVISFPPSPADWQHERILDDLASASGGRRATVAVVPNHNFLSVSNLRYEALRRG